MIGTQLNQFFDKELLSVAFGKCHRHGDGGLIRIGQALLRFNPQPDLSFGNLLNDSGKLFTSPIKKHDRCAGFGSHDSAKMMGLVTFECDLTVGWRFFDEKSFGHLTHVGWFDLVRDVEDDLQSKFSISIPALRMPEIVYHVAEDETVNVDLKSPYWAALLAWLFPGAGHIYQGRYAKGALFMICILSTFVFGLGLGAARCVTATNSDGKLNYYFIAQVGIGIPSFPAIIQSVKTAGGSDPFFVLCERFPEDSNSGIRFHKIKESDPIDPQMETLKDGFMAPPPGPSNVDNDVLGMWHYDYKHMFDMGILYTMIAGLLNLLAIYDAFCGPAIVTKEQKETMDARSRKGKRKAKVKSNAEAG